MSYREAESSSNPPNWRSAGVGTLSWRPSLTRLLMVTPNAHETLTSQTTPSLVLFPEFWKILVLSLQKQIFRQILETEAECFSGPKHHKKRCNISWSQTSFTRLHYEAESLRSSTITERFFSFLHFSQFSHKSLPQLPSLPQKTSLFQTDMWRTCFSNQVGARIASWWHRYCQHFTAEVFLAQFAFCFASFLHNASLLLTKKPFYWHVLLGGTFPGLCN